MEKRRLKRKICKKSGKYKEKFYHFVVKGHKNPIIGSIVQDTIDIGGGYIWVRPYRKSIDHIIEIRKSRIISQRFDYVK